MAYLAPIHQPSSIRHALKLNFLSPEDGNLVVAKANRLEIYTQTPDGLSLKHSKAVYGRIIMLNKIRPASATTDHLFVGTDRYMYFTLSWDASTEQVRTERNYVDQADKSARDSQTGDRCHIDPTRSYMTLELYEGVVTVIPIVKQTKKQTDAEIGSLGEPLPVRIPEMFVRSSTFFRNKVEGRKEQPKMALLYEDNYKSVKLKLRQIGYSPGLSGDGPSAELEEMPGFEEDLETGASHLIPVSEPAHGFVVLGETSITYWEDSLRQPLQRPLTEATIWITWEQIDAQRYILADEYGKLYMFMLEIDNQDNVVGWRLEVLGETSRASVLIYLGQGQVFVGSHQGDSQVITILPKALRVDQTLTNIAPILDFSIMDLGNRSGEGQPNEFSSGQARLITGSGAFKDGSLRTVRSGVGLEEQGLLDKMTNVTNIFSLKAASTSQFDDTLVVTFIDETRVFRFGADGDIEEVDEFKGLRLDTSTSYAGNVSGDKILQVTQSSVYLVDLDSGMTSGDWQPDKNISITAVTANERTVVIAQGGSTLIALDLTQDLATVAERSFDSDAQVACITIRSEDTAFCIIGFWGSSAISVLAMKDFSTIHTTNDGAEGVSVPRSLLVANVLQDHNPTLFIAMADGNVVTYSFEPSSGSVSGKQSIVLGTQQAELRRLPRSDGLDNVFATCSQPSLIYGSEGRLVYSALTAEDAACVCPFNAEAYPGAIAIATKEDLKIALIDEERSTHIQGLHIGETVRRIAYSQVLKAFGLGTISRSLDDGVEIVQSSFKLADEMTFYVQATYELNEDELVESVMRAELPDGSGGMAERFVLGTAYVDEDNSDSVRGRIIIFEVTEDRQLKVVTEHNVRGACRCLAMIDSKIVAALIKTVVMYSLDFTTASHPTLTKKASYRTSTAPIDLAISSSTVNGRPDTIAIADLMKSLSIVRYVPSVAPGFDDKLTEIARHFQTTWATATALISDGPNASLPPSNEEDDNSSISGTWLEADAEGNLIVLQQQSGADTLAEDRRRLAVTSEICLGEVVNRIRRIDIPTNPEAIVTPRAFLATVDGSIHLFALINPKHQNTLMRLQSALASSTHPHLASPGQIPFNSYRGYKNLVRDESRDGPFRFVDGELIERFLGCGADLQEDVVKEAGLEGLGIETIKGMVESLRRLR